MRRGAGIFSEQLLRIKNLVERDESIKVPAGPFVKSTWLLPTVIEQERYQVHKNEALVAKFNEHIESIANQFGPANEVQEGSLFWPIRTSLWG